MKHLILFTTLLIVATSGWARSQKGDTVFGNTLKNLICTKTVADFHRLGVNEEACMSSHFIFSEAPVRLNIEGHEESMTTLMQISFSMGEDSFVSELAANLSVSPSGAIVRDGWTVRSVSPQSISDETLLRTTWNGGNVEDFDPMNLPDNEHDKIADAVLEYALDLASNQLADADADDDSTEISEPHGEEWRKVVHPETRATLGYILPVGVANESADIRISMRIKVDTQGNIVDASVDSFGYHE